MNCFLQRLNRSSITCLKSYFLANDMLERVIVYTLQFIFLLSWLRFEQMRSIRQSPLLQWVPNFGEATKLKRTKWNLVFLWENLRVRTYVYISRILPDFYAGWTLTIMHSNSWMCQILSVPDDVVNGILFLLSDKAAMINGIVMPIDGGYSSC